jgi:hypothetical protein
MVRNPAFPWEKLMNMVGVDFYFVRAPTGVGLALGSGRPRLARLKSLTRAALRRWKSFGA